MAAFKITPVGLLFCFMSLALGSKCPEDGISKLVVCYYKSETSLDNFNICNCTHLVFTNGVRRAENNSLSATEDTLKLLEIIKERKENLSVLFTLETKQEETSKILKSENKSQELVNVIVDFLQESQFNGVELKFEFASNDGVSKESYTAFVKNLSKELSSKHRRIKRDGYDVFEKVTDDITTASYTTQTPKNSTSKAQSIKEKKPKEENNRKIREDKEDSDEEEKEEDEKNVDYETLEEAINAKFAEEKSEKQITLEDVEGNFEEKFLIFVRLSIQPEIIAKKYDLKALSRYSDILIVPTHNMVNSNEYDVTYHPSRLMGLSDILNTDSILDLLTGMGASKSKIVITLPATVLKFQLKDEKQNTPRSPARSKPQVIDQSQLCSLFNKNNWTIERDDDLTAPYAFSGKTWLAFEDETSVNIKGKYILLRELAGGAILPIDADVNDGLCRNRTGSGGHLVAVLHKNFRTLERKPRALILDSLQEEIHDAPYTSIEAGVKLSEYRIVRVVDHSGAVHVIRKNTKTQFECSRQGYFSHPLGCNKFYRCVKFDQYSDEFTVFEYDCPAGLAFDERWEVCVWPGSLPHGAPCTGSSEIAPVPRSHYQCPNREGYYADPENCRWFFACLDHARDGITPLTAYEFRCPFGLVFSGEKLACDWPWLVGTCGNKGAAGYLQVSTGGQSQGFHSTTFINGGNLHASLGQYGNTDAESAFIDFGKKFGSGLKGAVSYSAQGGYQGAQSAGFGYIANQFDDHNDRASFAAFPEYQISGGRILNKGGLVLDQHVATGISGVASGGAAGASGSAAAAGAFAGFVRNGGLRSLDSGSGFFHQETGSFNSGIHGTSNLDFNKVGPALQTNTLEISGINSGGQASFQNSVTTPKPFIVNIPSVEINAEKISEYSTVGQTTPQTVFLKQTPQSEKNNIQFTGKSSRFGISQPTLTVGIPAVTSTVATHAFGEALSGGAGVSHVIASTPKPEAHRFGQSQHTNKISANQASVTVGVPVVTGTESYKYTSAFSGSPAVPVSVPVVTPKPVVGTFTGDISVGQFSTPTESPFISFSQVNQGISENSAVEIPAKIPAVQPKVKQGFASGNIAQTGISYGAPIVTVTPAAGNTDGESHISAVFSGPTSIPFVHSTIDEKVTNEIKFNSPSSFSAVSTATPKKEFHTFSKVASALNVDTISNKIPIGKPEYTFSATGAAVKTKLGTTYGIPAVTPQSGLKSLKFGTSGVAVTPVVPFDSSAGHVPGVITGLSEATYNVPQTSVHSFPQASSVQQKGISQGEKISYGVPIVHSQTFVKPEVKISQPATAFGQRYSYFSYGSEFGKVQPLGTLSSTKAPANIQNIGGFASKIEQSHVLTGVSVQQQPIVSVGTVSTTSDQAFSTPSTNSRISSQNSDAYNINFKSSYVQPQHVTVTTSSPDVSITPIAPAEPNQPGFDIFGKPLHSIIQSPEEKIALESSGPALQQTIVNEPKVVIFNEKSFRQKEIKSFTPVATTAAPSSYDQGINTAFGAKSDFFGQSSAYSPPVTPKTETLRSTLHQSVGLKQSFSPVVTTAAPSSYNQGISASFGAKGRFSGQTNAYLPPVTPQNEIFGSTLQQSPGFKETFAPVVTTSVPPSYSEGTSTFGSKTGFYGQTAAYLPPVTPKSEVFGSTLEQSAGQFGRVEGSQVLVHKESVNQNFDFFKTEALEEKRTEFVQPVQVTTAVPVVTTTNKPTQKLLELEIAKSVEINPAVISQSVSPSPRPVVIQQQPVQLISEKTVKVKPSIQSFYQEKGVVHSQINNTPQEQYVFQPPEILQEKQYIPPAVVTPKPAVSYSTAKAIHIQKPAVAVTPAVPVFEASGVPITIQTENTISSINDNSSPAGFVKRPVFVGQFDNRQQDVVSSKVNLLLPTVTELPRYTPEELPVQTHQGFDSQRVTKFGGIPSQNVFIHPEITTTLKPSLNVFETSGQLYQYGTTQNFTSGHSAFGSGIKYAINPNIAIPDPPREYILSQNSYTTVAPEAVTTGYFQSTESAKNGITSPTYLPPQVGSSRKSSKTTLISVGNLNEEEVRDDDIQHIFDKYSGTFGQVINGRNDKFVTKVIKGEGRGKIEVDKQSSSTVEYEVSSTTPRQRSHGRQYHGAITSGLQATNKYEEYDINGDRGSLRSFDNTKSNQDKSENLKTTVDLKNLKLEKDKKTVIVVSQVSDANPVLIGKLAGQCSCQSNMLELRGKGKRTKVTLRRKTKLSQNQQQQTTITNEYLPPFESEPSVQIVSQSEDSTAAPDTVIIGGSKTLSHGVSYKTEQNFVSSSTTAQPEVASSTLLSSLGTNGVLSITPKTPLEDKLVRKKQFRGRARYLPPVISEDGSSVLSPVPASEIASTLDYTVLKGDESRTQNEIDGGRPAGHTKAGAAFDRYGPGGWRSFDETLQGSIDCKRPGLFRHPKHCNKFYACNYDPWEERYTLHVFNCPIQLTYDNSISACNWPVRGPACADDNLLV